MNLGLSFRASSRSQAGGKVYVLTRSHQRTQKAMAKTKTHLEAEYASRQRDSREFLSMHLVDNKSVKTTTLEFLTRQGLTERLDVLQAKLLDLAISAPLKGDLVRSRPGQVYHVYLPDLMAHGAEGSDR